MCYVPENEQCFPPLYIILCATGFCSVVTLTHLIQLEENTLIPALSRQIALTMQPIGIKSITGSGVEK